VVAQAQEVVANERQSVMRQIDWTKPEAYTRPSKRRRKNPNGSWGEAAVLLCAFLLGFGS
jgi:hypothetical protein